MKIFPKNADIQLEFDKIKQLLINYCRTEWAIKKVTQLRVHTHKEYVLIDTHQTYEYKLILEQNLLLPNDTVLNIAKDLQLLSIAGSTLLGEQWVHIRRLCQAVGNIFRWFNAERRATFTYLSKVLEDTYYEKNIENIINEVIDEYGNVLDSASDNLSRIRLNLYKKRNEQRKVFERVVSKLNKLGYLADIEESFSRGRRVVAVLAEYKRLVKGILHGESDSRRTVFIEPEETIELNNEVYILENEEKKEILQILKNLTATIRVYVSQLQQYYSILGLLDFVRAKALLAIEMQAHLPNIVDKPILQIINAYHPLLWLYNQKNGKKTIPLNVCFTEENRILIISGPNAGGKTVAMKTIGLHQLMLQSGLLIPIHPDSHIGIFKQLFIHMGDTQNLEFELSTYSSHLIAMKYFIEHANGKTLFFIDELGGGSDPNLGGAFAEVILEELARKKALGIVTTHYLNLKVMANHTKGLFNASMAFDEVHLQPLYQLVVGKPGSSYTFAIAERIGLPKHLINRAKKMVNDNHFKLDKLLNSTEQDLQQLEKERKILHKLIKENEKIKKEMEFLVRKEKHQQQIELLKHQNKISEEKINYLKDTERKLKQMIIDWRKADNKQDAIKNINSILFPKNEKLITGKRQRKIEEQYKETQELIAVGTMVKLKKNHQVGTVKELRGKRAIVQIGALPISVEVENLIAVEEKISETK